MIETKGTTVASAAAYQEEYRDLLFERTQLETHPSHQMLDRIEGSITTRESAERYIEALLDLIRGQAHPSHRILARVARMIRLLDLADKLAEQDDAA